MLEEIDGLESTPLALRQWGTKAIKRELNDTRVLRCNLENVQNAVRAVEYLLERRIASCYESEEEYSNELNRRKCYADDEDEEREPSLPL